MGKSGRSRAARRMWVEHCRVVESEGVLGVVVGVRRGGVGGGFCLREV